MRSNKRHRGDQPSLLMRLGAFGGLAFMHVPVFIIILYAFTTEERTYQFPPPGLTLHWFEVAFARSDIWRSLTLSLAVAACATLIALVLGTLSAFALARARFPGKDSLTALFVLPIALPGIITGIALLAAMKLARLEPSFFTIVAGHATFCTVIVYNNVIARLRRTSTSLVEASMDLGADGWQTFRFVTFPVLSTALISGALLAFALSFDEVIVTLFTAGAQNTLPIWILGKIRLGQQLPEVNAVVFFVIVLTVIPVVVSQRLTQESGLLRRR
jgi:putative spermidine/putrescine transport system permease protein